MYPIKTTRSHANPKFTNTSSRIPKQSIKRVTKYYSPNYLCTILCHLHSTSFRFPLKHPNAKTRQSKSKSKPNPSPVSSIQFNPSCKANTLTRFKKQLSLTLLLTLKSQETTYKIISTSLKQSPSRLSGYQIMSLKNLAKTKKKKQFNQAKANPYHIHPSVNQSSISHSIIHIQAKETCARYANKMTIESLNSQESYKH